MKQKTRGKFGTSTTGFAVSILVLAILAASGFGLYLSSENTHNTITLTSISLTTVTSTVSVVTTVIGSAISSAGTTTTSYSTSTVTRTASNAALAFNGTLVIIPNGVASNQSLNFTPSTIRIVAGANNTITWLNQDIQSQHTVVMESVPNGAQSLAIVLKPGQTYTATLTVPGTYRYYCMWHPGWMKGTIVVLSR